MTSDKKEDLKMPLIQQYSKTPELSVSNVFKLRPEELKLLFLEEHMELPKNQGEKRESLIILEKVGLQEGLLNALNTDSLTGIIGDEKDIKRRQTFFGSNTKQLPKIPGFFKVLLGQFEDLTIRILLIAATITFLIGYFDTEPLRWVEGASIYLAVALITLFTTSCDYLKSKQYLKLFDAIRDEEVSAVRGQYGLSQPCKVFDLVVGDIILIEAGMRVPADCLLLDAMDITVDESMYFEDRETITTKTISKGPEHHRDVNPDILLLTRSLVLTGSGRAVVCAVGKNTRISGKLENEELEVDETPTPLQQRLEKMVGILSKFGYICGFAIFCGMTLFLVCRIMFSEEAQMLSMDTLQKILRIFTVTIAVIMVAVPEGLPLAISISMAFSIDVMKKDNLLVKKMEACETLGQIREICTGKTATLTENNMSVNRFYTAQRTIVAENNHSLATLNQEVADIIKDCIIINNSSRIEMSDDAYYEPQGNGTEIAMLKFLQNQDIPIHELMADRFRLGEHETDIPFGPERKRQVVAITPNRANATFVRIVVKGAPEYVMPLCTRVLGPNGNTQDLSEEDASEILEQQILLPFASALGLRTLAYAYKDMDKNEWEELQAQYNNFEKEEDRVIIETDLTFVAGFGINDNLRKGVADSINQLQKAGINIRIISGDNKYTAIECAKKVGVLKDGEENVEFTVMEGKEFREYFGGVNKVMDAQGNEKFEFGDRKKFIQVARHVKVLYRSTPLDKFTLIAGLQTLKSSIAVTADGIADATSLKQANVGFCMGISGCEVAKDAADIVILDDNFNSVFRATQWGKNILDNIRKFIQFQLTVNIVCMVMVFLGGTTIGVTPFSVIQMLWINMIMDTLAALSLATEPPHSDDFQTAQQKKGDKIILPVMWRNILGQALYQLLILIVMLYSVPYWFGIDYKWIGTNFADTSPIMSTDPLTGQPIVTGTTPTQAAINMKLHYTIIFNTFVLMNLFNQINSRKLSVSDLNVFKRFFNNFYFLVVLGAEFAAQWFIVAIGGLVFRTEPLTLTMHITCYSFGVGSLLVGLALKKIPEAHLDKLTKIPFKEDGGDDTDALSQFTKRISGGIQKSETQRLLDSN